LRGDAMSKVEELRLELRRLPGGVAHFIHSPEDHAVTISVASPCIGVFCFEVDDLFAERIAGRFLKVRGREAP
jgi:hypothetical protein